MLRKDMAGEPAPRECVHGLGQDTEERARIKGEDAACQHEAELDGSWVHVTCLEVVLDQGSRVVHSVWAIR